MMVRVIDVKAGPDYTLELKFEDGVQGRVSIADRLFGPVFESLKDPEFFAQVRVDDFGAVCWPNDADLAPNALYRSVLAQQQEGSLPST